MPNIPQERKTISKGLLPSQGNSAQQNAPAPSINKTGDRFVTACSFHYASIFTLKDLRTEQSVRQVRFFSCVSAQVITTTIITGAIFFAQLQPLQWFSGYKDCTSCLTAMTRAHTALPSTCRMPAGRSEERWSSARK